MTTSVAIDGPAGAGKSTVAKKLAEKLNFTYLDSGAMYRAVTLAALEDGVDVNNKEKLKRLVKDLSIDIEYKNNNFKIYMDDQDITNEIRTEKVDNNVSAVAKIKAVRDELVKKQRMIAQTKDIVMDGRDIGTRVLPQADYKFYITATVKERAKRRYKDVVNRGEDKSFEEVQQEIIRRDRIDSNRKYSPLKKAEDAVVIDTTDLNKEQVLKKILRIIRGE
ncbi:MAG TPA: (d)CMP kinase [Halanaerobiales bacterium]|nr:(d)CMP kinase [Halanaerobiales bacterium]